MTRRTRAMFRKEMRQIFRDKRTLGVLLVLPAFLLVMFGYAISLDVENASIAVVDYDHSPESRKIVEVLSRSRYVDVRFRPASPNSLNRLYREGKAQAAVVIPRGYGEALAEGSAASVQILIDGSDGTTGNTVLGYLRSIIAEVPSKMDGDGTVRRIDFRPRVWFNPELESNQFLIPGLVAFILIVTAVISTALSVVREKEHGSMEQLAVSPLSPSELILGKTLPYLVVSFVIAVSIFVSSYLFFDIVIAGSYLLLLGVTLLFLFACLGFGVFISTLAETQQVAFLIAILSTFLPSFILSGFVFPIRNMPVAIQAVTYLVPARHYLSALRAIVLKGAGLEVIWRDIVLLLLFSLVMVGAGSYRIRKGSFDR
ncbi:MAG: ABC transporter permease [Spirochaetota bacterium]